MNNSRTSTFLGSPLYPASVVFLYLTLLALTVAEQSRAVSVYVPAPADPVKVPTLLKQTQWGALAQDGRLVEIHGNPIWQATGEIRHDGSVLLSWTNSGNAQGNLGLVHGRDDRRGRQPRRTDLARTPVRSSDEAVMTSNGTRRRFERATAGRRSEQETGRRDILPERIMLELFAILFFTLWGTWVVLFSANMLWDALAGIWDDDWES